MGLIQTLDHFLEAFVDIWAADIIGAQSAAFSVRGACDSEEEFSDLDYTDQVLHLDRSTVFETT
jgi:hypothetical protein